jgi:hypothetical protein
MMSSMIPVLLAALAGQAASDVCSGAAISMNSALSSKPDLNSTKRPAWCQANLTVVTTAVTNLNTTNCSDYNVTDALAGLPVITTVCGPCGDAMFNITNLLPQGDVQNMPLFCQQTLPQIATAVALLNGTACASMFRDSEAAAGLSEMINGVAMKQSICNPCFLQMMSVEDQLVAGCKPVVDASNGTISSSNAGTAASKPLCVSASCALAAPWCTAANVQSVAKTAQMHNDSMIAAFTQIVQTWLPTFSCESVVTLVGTLSLNVSNASAFLNDRNTKRAVAAGIAQFLGVSNDSVSVTFGSTRRLSERKLQTSSLQATYSVGVVSANASAVTIKLAQATQSALATSINAAIATSGSQAGQVAVVGLTLPTTTTTTRPPTNGTTVGTGQMSSSYKAGPMMSFLLAGFVAFSFTRAGTSK